MLIARICDLKLVELVSIIKKLEFKNNFERNNQSIK